MMADILSAGGMELIKYFCFIPFLCGFIIYILWDNKFSLGGMFAFGQMFMWALCESIGVVMTLLGHSFSEFISKYLYYLNHFLIFGFLLAVMIFFIKFIYKLERHRLKFLKFVFKKKVCVDKFLKKYVFWHRKREIKDFSEEEFDKPCGVLGSFKESSVLYKRGVEYFKSLRLNKIYDWFSVVMLALFLWYLFKSIITLQHTDFDDSRFVALAGDILETGRLYRTDPATGNILMSFTGEIVKDITSVWALNAALMSYFTGIKPVIVFHSIYPVYISALITCVYYRLGKVFFKESTLYAAVFTFAVWVVNIFGYKSVYTAETFLTVRLWQGKAVVAGFGVPLVFYLFTQLYKKYSNLMSIFLAFCVSLGMCLMSGNGIVIAPVTIGVLTVITFIFTGRARVLLCIFAAVPCAYLWMLYEGYVMFGV